MTPFIKKMLDIMDVNRFEKICFISSVIHIMENPSEIIFEKQGAAICLKT